MMTILQAHPDLRARAKRLVLRAESALREWLTDGERADWTLSTRMRRQWARLLRDLEPAASPELKTEIKWWRARLKRWDNQTLPEIWQSLLTENR